MGSPRPQLRRLSRRAHARSLICALEPRHLFATINVTSYGANPDDLFDDRAAIVSAINASNDGDTIYFPGATIPGSAYLIAQEISTNSSDVHKPLGRGRIFKGDTTFTTNDQPHATVEEGYTVQDRSILRATTTVGTQKNVIFRFRETNPNPATFNVKFTGLTFDGRGLMLHVNTGKVEGVVIDNNHFMATGAGDNNNVETTSGLRNCAITNNLFWCDGNTGVFAFNFDGLTIANNWFINRPGTFGNQGIHIFGFMSGNKNMLIEQNYFAGLRRMGIEYQYNGLDTIVQDNWYEKPWISTLDSLFAFSVVCDTSQNTITRRNTAIMPPRVDNSGLYVRIVYEIGGANVETYDNYSWGGNDAMAINGYLATGKIGTTMDGADRLGNHLENFHHNTGNNNLATTDWTINNNGASEDLTFNPDGRSSGSIAPIRYRPLTNRRYAGATKLTGAFVGSSSINLSWKDLSSNETEFRIERKMDGLDWMQVGTAPANATSYSMPSQIGGGTFEFRVCAYSFNYADPLVTDYSNIISVQVPVGDLTSTPPPPAPQRTRPLIFFGGGVLVGVAPPIVSEA